MNHKVFKLRPMMLLILTLILVIGIISACSKEEDVMSGKIKVVAAENFYGEVAIAVGGDKVEVISILDNREADPHDYEPTPDASKKVNHAKVVIYNGIGYDEWMKKLIDASGTAANKKMIAVGSDAAGQKDGDNEHPWYNPETMLKFARLLAYQLSDLDPDHSSVYKKQAEDYIAALEPLTQLIKELKQSSP